MSKPASTHEEAEKTRLGETGEETGPAVPSSEPAPSASPESEEEKPEQLKPDGR